MRLDKNTLLDLLRQGGQGDKADRAAPELPSEVDTDNQDHLAVLQRFGIDPQTVRSLLDKVPQSVKDKLPGDIGKLLP